MGGIWQHSNTAQLVCLECGQCCSLHSVEWFSLHCCTYVRVDVCCKCTHSAAWLVSLPRSLVLAGWSTQVSMLYFSMYLLFHVCVRMLYNLHLLVLRWYAEHMAITGCLCNSQFTHTWKAAHTYGTSHSNFNDLLWQTNERTNEWTCLFTCVFPVRVTSYLRVQCGVHCPGMCLWCYLVCPLVVHWVAPYTWLMLGSLFGPY